MRVSSSHCLCCSAMSISSSDPANVDIDLNWRRRLYLLFRSAWPAVRGIAQPEDAAQLVRGAEHLIEPDNLFLVIDLLEDLLRGHNPGAQIFQRIPFAAGIGTSSAACLLLAFSGHRPLQRSRQYVGVPIQKPRASPRPRASSQTPGAPGVEVAADVAAAPASSRPLRSRTPGRIVGLKNAFQSNNQSLQGTKGSGGFLRGHSLLRVHVRL